MILSSECEKMPLGFSFDSDIQLRNPTVNDHKRRHLTSKDGGRRVGTDANFRRFFDGICSISGSQLQRPSKSRQQNCQQFAVLSNQLFPGCSDSVCSCRVSCPTQMVRWRGEAFRSRSRFDWFAVVWCVYGVYAVSGLTRALVHDPPQLPPPLGMNHENHRPLTNMPPVHPPHCSTTSPNMPLLINVAPRKAYGKFRQQINWTLPNVVKDWWKDWIGELTSEVLVVCEDVSGFTSYMHCFAG